MAIKKLAAGRSDFAPPAGAEYIGGAARFRTWLVAVIIAVVTVALYWPAVHFDFVNFDDPNYVFANPHVQAGLTKENVVWAFTTGRTANWHPLTWLSLMLDSNIFGLKAGGFHLTNLVLHAANGVLLFLLLRRTTGALWRSAGVAALFAWHPLHVESVAWVAERKDVLSTFFGFLSLLFYTGYAQSGPVREGNRGRRILCVSLIPICYTCALVCFILGLLGKSMLVTWPLVMLLLDYWPLGRWQPGCLWILVREKIPFFALAFAACVVTFLVQRSGGAVVNVTRLPMGMRCENALVSYGRYLEKLFWPAKLAVFYPHPGYWPVEIAVTVALVLGVISLFSFLERHRQPFWLVGWLWYCGTLVPVIGLVQVGEQSMADRYFYIPSVGVLVMALWGLNEITRRWPWQKAVLSGVGIATLTCCLVLARRQLDYWGKSESLFRHALAVTKNNYVAHDGLGSVLVEKNQIAEAIGHYHEALRIAPGFTEVHNDLGIALFKQDQTDAAIREFRESLRGSRDFPEAHNDLGAALFRKDKVNEAISQFQAALRLDPENAEAHDNLGLAFAKKGQVDASIQQYREAIKLDPQDAFFHDNLALELAHDEQADEAISQWREAVRLKFTDLAAHQNIGLALEKKGRSALAIVEYQQILRLNPEYPSVRESLARLLLKEDRYGEAVGEYEEIITRQPENALARENLGLALVKEGRINEAIQAWQYAVRLNPNEAAFHKNLGILLSQKGQGGAAQEQFEDVVKIQPADASAHVTLGIVLAIQGRNDGAVREFREAVRLDPGYAQAHDNLGIVLARLGQSEEAAGQYREALQLQPDYPDAQSNLMAVLALKMRPDGESPGPPPKDAPQTVPRIKNR